MAWAGLNELRPWAVGPSSTPASARAHLCHLGERALSLLNPRLVALSSPFPALSCRHQDLLKLLRPTGFQLLDGGDCALEGVCALADLLWPGSLGSILQVGDNGAFLIPVLQSGVQEDRKDT